MFHYIIWDWFSSSLIHDPFYVSHFTGGELHNKSGRNGIIDGDENLALIDFVAENGRLNLQGIRDNFSAFYHGATGISWYPTIAAVTSLGFLCWHTFEGTIWSGFFLLLLFCETIVIHTHVHSHFILLFKVFLLTGISYTSWSMFCTLYSVKNLLGFLTIAMQEFIMFFGVALH